MTARSGARSLFWTFAGIFLLVLALATALQIVVSVGVLRPLAAMTVRDRAELMLMRTARELATLPRPPAEEDVRRVLRANRVDRQPIISVFRDGAGAVIVEPPLPPYALRSIPALLAGGSPDSLSPAPGPPAARPAAPPPAARFRGPGLAQGPRPLPHRDSTPGGRFPGPGWREGHAPGPGGEMRMEVLARRTVPLGGVAAGEVVAIGPTGGPGRRWWPEAHTMLLFLPFAVLAAGAAGLLMVRILVRRLRALEQLAARVTEGDLAARVEGRGLDEIGRLEERFNRMTERLATAREELERAGEQRSRLLADITHELSTPMTSIRGYVETLLDPAVPTSDEERNRYLHDVLDEAMRLDLLIRDLFDLVRLEAGANALVPVRLDWAALCRNTARRFEPRLRDAGLTLRWRDELDEAWVHADGRRMEQVVENLLTNALRYVPAGGTVTLALERADTSSGARYRFSVADDGPGIAADDLPHVFERFYRADAVRGSGGSGLGLAIVREIIERHGGQVRAGHVEPHGAAFAIELPVPPA